VNAGIHFDPVLDDWAKGNVEIKMDDQLAPL
jgi:hypothetical protein